MATATKKTTVEETRNPDFALQEPARTRDEALAAAVAPVNQDVPNGKPPSKAEFNADAPVVTVKGGVVVLSVGGNSTALSGDDIVRLGKQLSALSQLQTGQHFDRDATD